MSDSDAESEREIHLEMDDSHGKNAHPEVLAHIFHSIASTLEDAPDGKYYDFEITIEERDVGGKS